MKRVVVASKNPVKIQATKMAFGKMFPNEEFVFEGVAAKSGVADQPMSESETLTGATNRVIHAKELVLVADYWVGLEGGLERKDGELEAFAWMAIIDVFGKVGKGRTGSFFLPKKVADLIAQGKELGEADDIVFGLTNSKQQSGAVGILTGEVITRATYYEPAIIFALMPFKNAELY